MVVDCDLSDVSKTLWLKECEMKLKVYRLVQCIWNYYNVQAMHFKRLTHVCR